MLEGQYNLSANATGGIPQATKESTPSDVLNRIFDKLAATNQHISEASQKAVGNVLPPDGPTAAPAAGPPNILSMLYSVEDQLNRILELARNLNNRL